MATQSRNKNIAKTYGPGGTEFAFCSFTTTGAATNPTVVEAQGVASVVRANTGLFDVQLSRTGLKFIGTQATIVTANGSTQSVTVVSKNFATGVVRVSLTTTGGNVLIDTVNTIDLFFTLRTKS